MRLPLFLTLIFLMSSLSFAQSFSPSCFNEEGEFDESCWTDPNCRRPGEKPEDGNLCCQGLELNAAGICDEPALRDEALVQCSSQSDCSSGLGCMPQRGEDLFSILSPNTSSPEILRDKRSIVEHQMGDADVVRAAGAACAHARECESYSCVAGRCENRRVCRFAGLGEGAGPGVNCGSGLVKNGSGICDLSPESKNIVYLGLIDDTTLRTVGQCQMALPEDTVSKAKNAMSSMRAMEWFFSTISVPQSEECFNVLPVIQESVGKTFHTSRKTILKNFSDVLNTIEFDYKQVIDAKKDSSKMLTIHNGEQISEKDLAGRQSSGYDGLMIMYRRNILFEELEKAMLTTVKGVNDQVVDLSQVMGTWKDSETSWRVNGQTFSNPSCEGSKYKKKGLLSGWKTKYWQKNKDRWSVHYQVNGSAPLNADIVKRENVAKYLGLIGGTTPDEAVANFTKPTYYMMDPMMFGGLSNKSYGRTKKLKKSGSFLGLFGGFKDLRKAFHIDGQGSGSFTAIHNDLKPKLKEYFKTLKQDAAQKGFVYEPELFTTDAKDCLDNPENPEKCAGFDAYLDEVLDQGFAHFLAYSHHTDDSYSNYFQNAATYRRKLLAKLEVDLQNLQMYYDAVSKLRKEQNDCITKVIDGIIKDGILESGEKGIAEDTNGPGNGPQVAGNPLNTSGAGSGSLGAGEINRLGVGGSNLGANLGNPLDRTNYQFDLLGNNPTTLSGTRTNLSGGSSDTGPRISMGSAANLSAEQNAQMAARSKALKDANAKAKSAGVDVDSKKKKVNDILASMSSSRTNGGGGSAGGMGSSSSNSFNSSSSSKFVGLEDSDTKDKTSSGITGEVFSQGDAQNKQGNLASAAKNPYGTYGDGGSQYGAGSGTNSNNRNDNVLGRKSSDALTDADQEWVLKSYERNQSAYEGSDEDGLFQKVSKAYVRNLEKILDRKKID